MREAAKTIENQIIAWRREIHRHPEIGLETTRTAALVSSALKEMGIEVREGVGGHGVVGLLRGEGSPGQEDSGGRARTIALSRYGRLARARGDRSPVRFRGAGPYACLRTRRSRSHAAGGAKILSGMRNSLKGNVKFIFQPGEEGPGGARPMIDDRALEDPRPQAIVGAHLGKLWNVAHGKVGFRAGPLMAATDRFDVLVQGMGGHGAAPHTSVDPVVVASHIVVALQTIVSREINPTEPAVVTVGVIEAGSANNIIPDKCVMKGTVRYMNKDLGPFVSRRIKEIAESMASGMRAEATVQYHFGYPPLVNDAEITERVKMSAAKVVGAENIVVAGQTMGAEDMSYYLDKVPGTFFAIGSSSEAKGIVYPNHHPKFDIDEDVLHLGSAISFRHALIFWAVDATCNRLCPSRAGEEGLN